MRFHSVFTGERLDEVWMPQKLWMVKLIGKLPRGNFVGAHRNYEDFKIGDMMWKKASALDRLQQPWSSIPRRSQKCFFMIPKFLFDDFFRLFFSGPQLQEKQKRLKDKIRDFLPENCLYCLNCRHHLTIFPAIISSLSLLLPHLHNFDFLLSTIFPQRARQSARILLHWDFAFLYLHGGNLHLRCHWGAFIFMWYQNHVS